MIDILYMPKRSRKDENQLGKSIVDRATGQDGPVPDEDTIKRVMREIGRRGGLKGGKARAKKLSAKRRSQIASKAARARWRKKRGNNSSE